VGKCPETGSCVKCKPLHLRHLITNCAMAESFRTHSLNTKCSPLKEEMMIFYFLLSDMMTTVEFLMGTDIRIQT
jgi:hypothetical protein